MSFELLMPIVMIAIDGGYLDRPIHSDFDLADRQATAAGYREVNAVVGENRMDLARQAAMRWRRKSAATRVVDYSCSSIKANFGVRSMATKR